MNNLTRILTVLLWCAPLMCANAAGPVATTSGSNLTAFNPSNSYNNQWATVSNGRYDDTPTTAKVNFGNCNAVILRCAQPKCKSGGCANAAIAGPIVTGCVNSNDKCRQFGQDLINSLTMQLVADSVAKINEQNAETERARAQAEAAAAAAQSAAQNEQMQQMQQQMMAMQQQMAEQQAQSQQQLQDALAQQAAQSAAALENMKAAATAAAQQTESGISSYEQDAINRGVSADVLERKKIAGQVMTDLEDAELKMKNLKTILQNSFKYAGCDARGNNCTGPRRVKKWRELASGFVDVYDEAIDKIYEAMETAMIVGIDLSQIYMMLSDSCSRWGQYMCQPGTIDYSGDKPKSIPNGDDKKYTTCLEKCQNTAYASIGGMYYTDRQAALNNPDFQTKNNECIANCSKQSGGKECTLLKILSNAEDVYAGWVDADEVTDGNTTVVHCASSALDNYKLFTRRTRRKNGAGMVDIDTLDTWLHHSEPVSAYEINMLTGVCYTDGGTENELKKAIAKKAVPTNDICGTCEYISNSTQKEYKCKKTENSPNDDDLCGEIAPNYAICDTHMLNAGKSKLDTTSTINNNNGTNTKTFEISDQDKIKQMIGLKITVISQQMYKQYQYLDATMKRLQIQLKKAALTATLESAGAKDGDSSSSGGLAGGASMSDKQNGIYLPNAQNCNFSTTSELGLACLQQNALLIANEYKNKNAIRQLYETIKSANMLLTNDNAKSMISTSCENCYKREEERRKDENEKIITYITYKPAKTYKDCNLKNDALRNCAYAINRAASIEQQAAKERQSGINVLQGLLKP